MLLSCAVFLALVLETTKVSRVGLPVYGCPFCSELLFLFAITHLLLMIMAAKFLMK